MEASVRFHPIAWKSKVIQKRSTFNITINKLVADGCNIQKGDTLHSYIGEDHNRRPIMITYLDGNERVWTNQPINNKEEDTNDPERQ
jgi:hypothetical protein